MTVNFDSELFYITKERTLHTSQSEGRVFSNSTLHKLNTYKNH